MPTPGASANPASAALPVSPEVAVTIMIFSSPAPSFEPVRAMRRGSIWRATSLKALVGPCHSSSTCVGTPSALAGARRFTGVSCLASVAGGGGDDHDLLVPGAVVRARAGHEAGQHLEGDVFEGTRGAVPQLEHVCGHAVGVGRREALHGGDFGIGESLLICLKLPRTPQTATLAPSWVLICSSCTRLTLPSG